MEININTLNDQSFIDSKSLRNPIMKDDATCSWGNTNSIIGEVGDFVTWPPRCYTCTFCKREFRSAQALGGHMNVHRRDRARLRQITSSQIFSSTYNIPWLNLNLHPNPNTNPNSARLSSSSQQTRKTPYLSMDPSYDRFSDGEGNLTMMKSHMPGTGCCEYHRYSGSDNKGQIETNSEMVRWSLEMGLLDESKPGDLDLELRLGC